MAIGPIGAHIYVNQNMTALATKQAELQNRLDMQNAIASASANEKEEEVREVRPTEETYKIDPQREHEKQKNEEESGAKKEEITRDSQHKEHESAEEESIIQNGHLDIKV
ncbi:MAG: hypothetical protein IBX44_08700 [Sulfurospirillum sp.]|nr:hypothetical protein [Sulfurospirillum sp.]